MTDNKHKGAQACPYRDGKVCKLPYPFMVCPHYQDGGYKKDEKGEIHFEQSTCGACRENDD